MKRMKENLAFTLIELLIVVAIIAILAAIAVPNFLEAQTRAKVARCKADQRTAATAIESYAVDWTRVPIGQGTYQKAGCVGYPFAKGMGNITENVWAKMTTPISYITQGPYDVFIDKGSISRTNTGNPGAVRLMQYHDWMCKLVGAGQNKAGYNWGIFAIGPSRFDIIGFSALTGQGWDGVNVANIQFPYDATNGTISLGLIVRTNKGFWTAPNS